MKEYFYFSIIVILISYIFLGQPTKKSIKKKKRHPSGDYVLKIIVNEQKKKDCKLIIDVLKKSVFEIVPILFEDTSLYNKWRSCGEGKVVLIGKEEDLGTICSTSKEQNIPCYLYDDVMVVVGPGLKKDINKYTGHLKLF
ncbi:Peptidyl-tRNA hydrolase [Nosema granulosis]|uniref:peptidyl-tRNA hydrolase n=1 Tax=Nosema granulosis TaxID=83296 RepID=A0A9P6GYE9_9MICR|nr:Peptidyl-tRNA hydrolase [Nosema granulosis]